MLRSLPPYYLVRNPLSFIYEYIIYVSAQQITLITMEQTHVSFIFKPSRLSWAFLITSLKATFRSNGDTASHVELHSKTLKHFSVSRRFTSACLNYHSY